MELEHQGEPQKMMAANSIETNTELGVQVVEQSTKRPSSGENAFKVTESFSLNCRQNVEAQER